ncbi:hypothetical protein Fmac_005506 [Flemingia macrophylla]|uniref:Uncharacterized protein n=1 Tax=Flemingia macrophylla TaxID=520843 RepID=A0ABD1N8I5_9FABA
MIPTDKMVVVGPGATDFVTEISFIIQKHAPYNIEKWKFLYKAIKKRIVTKVLNTFHIDGANLEHTKEVILDTVRRLYRSHKCRLHQHFKKFETIDMALEHKPHDLSTEDSEYLVHHFSSSKFKIKVQEVALEKLKGISEEIDKDQIVNDVFQSVVGERSGCCRGFGVGIQPTKGKSITYICEQLTNEREKCQTIKMKLKKVDTQLQEERSKREEMTTHFEDIQRQIEESQRTLEERMEKRFQERIVDIFFRMPTFTRDRCCMLVWYNE